MRSFAAKTPDGLPEHLVGLPVLGIQFVSESFSPRGLLTFAPQRTANAKKRAGFISKPSLIDHLLFA